jgi:CxxC motif-containing protein (DUF1111 family)
VRFVTTETGPVMRKGAAPVSPKSSEAPKGENTMVRRAGRTRISSRTGLILCLTLLMVVSFAGIAVGQFGARDPGVRSGQAGVGGPRTGLTGSYPQFFATALTRFNEVDSVSGTQAGSNGGGLGPRFNGISCAGCHAQPATGGTSPAINPQIGFARAFGGHNEVPSFISLDGPVREARFIRQPNGSPDGGVHDLFVITGMPDAGNCNIAQPDFGTAVANQNVIFRIPTPVFGLGMVEEITDANILANAASNQWEKNALGIHGHANTSGNDGTITRFGWKAQNKSLLMFAGEAYNVEMGVTNDIFPNERDETPGCLLNPLPEDSEGFSSTTFPPSDMASDITNFAMFMRLSAAPVPATPTDSTQRGSALFGSAGCALCHTPSISTGSTSLTTGQTNVAVNAFSDFLVHDMGTGLADGVSQGAAGPNEFRTAPLWGLGQRIFFLHDGRTNDLLAAIRQHASNGSEANGVIARFNGLTEQQKQDLLNFLRSL